MHKIISIFSGAMGLDLGFEKAGFKTSVAVEIDKKIAETIKLNKPNLPLINDDIRNYNAEDLLNVGGLRKDEVFAIIGGPPCQAFSSAGKQQGLDDKRGNVFLKYLEIINYIKPQYVVIENVRGILSTPVQNNPKTIYPISVSQELLQSKSGTILLVLDQLQKMGYTVTFTLYNTANYGIPQSRERVIILCHLGKKEIPLIPPTHFEDKKPYWKTLRDAIGDMDTSKMKSGKFPEKRIKYYKHLSGGQNWSNLPEDLKKEAMGKSYLLSGGKTGFFRRLSWDKPSPTLVTSPSMPATDLCHPDEIRPLSIEEYARIQQFPDNWKFAGNLSYIYKQIGNAVPVGFGEIIANHILDFHSGKLNKSNDNNDIKYSRYKNTSHKYFKGLLQPNITLKTKQLTFF